MEVMQPGDTISPQKNSDKKEHEFKIPREESKPQSSDQHLKSDRVPEPVQQDAAKQPGSNPAYAEHQQDEPSPWSYTSEVEVSQPYEQPVQSLESIEWTASEFLDHDKDKSWFVKLGFGATAAIALIYLVTRDAITAAAIMIAAVLFGIVAHRKPRILQYAIDQTGIHIGEKLYTYADFKSFSVLEEGVFNSIQLMPMKRFMPTISLYYPLDQEDKVMDVLGSYLAYADHKHDSVDRLMRRIRF